MGGNAPRILSLDDYFTVENDVETTDPVTGKSITKKVTLYFLNNEQEVHHKKDINPFF